MKTGLIYSTVLSVILFGCVSVARAQQSPREDSSPLRVYEVNKRVSDFTEKEDFSTPESACAVIYRVMASGEEGKWRRISTSGTARRLPPVDAKKKEVKPKWAKLWGNAMILEVRVFKERRSVVLLELKPGRIDNRYVELEGERWLNTGAGSPSRTLAEARLKTNRGLARSLDKPVRPRIEDPESYLKPLIQFLKDNAQEPKAFIMEALASHKVVIMGEVHHRPRYWAFNSSLVSDPKFPKHVGTIYMELPSNNQHLVDKFLTSDTCDTMLIIEMLRDNLWMGWPDQPMLDFFTKIWMANQNLPADQRLRIVLVDMQRPWSKIKNRRDWNQYQKVSRDQQMADNIIKDFQAHPKDNRNALFIVGVAHAGLNLEYFKGAPVLDAGWYLREELGEKNVFSILPHTDVGTNMGRIDGRLALGLFDSAFAALDNKPMAFPLDVGPFGTEPFDAFVDEPVRCNYRDGYSAYLYLGPLETEIFSPLIAGFYTDEFVKELERRHKMMYGRGWAEAYHQEKSDAEHFIEWMSGSGGTWGKPRKWTKNRLGPLDAWHHGGSDWKKTLRDEKHANAMKYSEEIRQAARQLFEKTRDADYEYFLNPRIQNHDLFPTWLFYIANGGHDELVRWMCNNFKDNPITDIELGNVFVDQDSVTFGLKALPTVPYKITLTDGTVLEGKLPFKFQPSDPPQWIGMKGMDWHIQYPNGLPRSAITPKPRAN